jgi:hypothetical protein
MRVTKFHQASSADAPTSAVVAAQRRPVGARVAAAVVDLGDELAHRVARPQWATSR